MDTASHFQGDYSKNGYGKIPTQNAPNQNEYSEPKAQATFSNLDEEEKLLILKHRRAKLKQDPLAPDAPNASEPETNESTSQEEESKHKPSQATRLIKLVENSGCELWRSLDGEPFITIDANGHKEHHPLKTKAVRHWVERMFYTEEHIVPNAQAVQDVLGVLRGKALFDGSEYPLFVRVGRYSETGNIYLDLSNDNWQAVEITPDGWQVVDEPPVRFKRTKGMLPLPMPARRGNISELRRFVNVADEEAWILLTAFIVVAMWPEGPYPLLAPVGEQGTAKTTLARLIKSLVDPNISATRAEPGNKQDLAIGAAGGWLLAYDNLSSIPNWLSDALCRLSTGGGFSTRELYTVDEEVIFDAMRPVALTAIEEVITRGDLLDRCIVLNLVPIPDKKRRAESELWQDFERARPIILGALLDALSVAMRNLPSVRLERLPRMADFARLIVSCETALGHKPGAFMRAYTGNRADANSLALDTPVVIKLIEFISEHSAWEGTASELLAELDRTAGYSGSDGYKHTPKEWPRTPRALSGVLRRLAPNLRQGANLAVGFGRDKGKARKRLIQIEKLDARASEASEHYTATDDMDDADDSFNAFSNGGFDWREDNASR